ncbi:tetratricopeptide repeat protein [Undibacterium sp. Di26W]|uniref:tetratricopeptide repeat protein n=1 Tax=Undibacterium sp. Di26W TaxID=3413035 RepID=UPI003BF2B31B
MATLCSVSAFAEEPTITVISNVKLAVAHAKGVEFSADSEALHQFINTRQFEEADKRAKLNCASYESIFDRSKKQFSFQSDEEFREFNKANQLDFEWIDWGYKTCLQTQAFVAVENRDLERALTMLRRVEALAPVSAGTSTEIGYILNQQGKPASALQAYRHAQELSTRYLSQRPYLAIALRGIGFSLIELKQLDEAEKAFQESLQIEPGNKLATSELSYIQGLREQRQKTQLR